MDIRDMNVGSLGLSARALGRLEYANVIRVGQLLDMDEWDLRDTPRLGPKILTEIKDALARNGLELKPVDPI